MTELPSGTRPLDPREQQAISLMQAGALPQAEAIFMDVLSERPHDHQIMNALAILAAQQGRPRESIRMFERALKHAPGDGGPTDNTAAIIQNIGVTAYTMLEQKDWAGALAAYRKVLELDPDNAEAPKTIMHCVMMTGGTPRLADFAPGVDESELGTHIVVACMPQSRPALLSTALASLTGWPEVTLTYAFLQNEEEIYLPFLRKVARSDTVSRLHLRANVANLQMMQAFKIRPVVMVRNLYDAVVSYADFLDNGAKPNAAFAGRWAGLPREHALDLVTDSLAPRYIGFYASWWDVMRQGLLDCRLLRQEDLIADPQSTLERLADFYGLGKSPAACAAALARADRRPVTTDEGKAGRGAEELSAAQKDRIRALAAYYPDVDFGPVGL